MPDLPYRYVLWDWNGTLLDDTWLCVAALNHVLATNGKPGITVDSYREHFHFPVRSYYEHLGFDPVHSDYPALAHDFFSAYEERRKECRLCAGTDSLITAFADAHIPQGILSAHRETLLRRAVQELSLAHRFAHVVGQENGHAEGKLPSALVWLEQSRIPGEQILLIGDTTHDFEVAQAMGAAVLLVASGHQHEHRLRETGAPVVSDFHAAAVHLGLNGSLLT